MSALPRKRATPEEYLAFDRSSQIKHEYLDGDIYAMSGASEKHVTIAWNLGGVFYPYVRAKGCRAFGSDMRVRAGNEGYFYPDLSFVCGKPQIIPEDALDILLNSTLIIEILSPSTERFDRGQKFLRYQALDSLQEYILIEQHTPLIERYSRQPNEHWLYSTVRGLQRSD